MTEPLEIPSETLLQLADALVAGHVRGPLTKFGLRAFTTSVGAIRSRPCFKMDSTWR